MATDSGSDKKLAVNKVKYGRGVVKSIISLAIQEISGVASLHGNGFKFWITGNTIDIDVYIDVMFGNSCSEVAFKVQENIKNSIETMSTFKMGSINVSIVEVIFNEKIANAL